MIFKWPPCSRKSAVNLSRGVYKSGQIFLLRQGHSSTQFRRCNERNPGGFSGRISQGTAGFLSSEVKVDKSVEELGSP